MPESAAVISFLLSLAYFIQQQNIVIHSRNSWMSLTPQYDKLLLERPSVCGSVQQQMTNIHFGIYTMSQKKQSKLFFHNYVKCLLTLIICGTLMAKTTKLCKVQNVTVWSVCVLHGSALT